MLERLKAALRRSKIVQRLRRASKDKAWRAYVKQRERFRARKKITERRAKAVDAARTSPIDKAIKWGRANLGEVESPPSSNRGLKISAWQRSFGSWLVGQPWCGVFVGMMLRAAGVKVTSRIASVAMIEDDARAGRNGFKSWHARTDGRRGDVAVLFGRGIHTEYVVARESWGLRTYGGNTSAEGSSGSQSNGGQSAPRNRPWSQIYGIARPNYS